MSNHDQHSTRLDVPASFGELYPGARANAPLEVVRAGEAQQGIIRAGDIVRRLLGFVSLASVAVIVAAIGFADGEFTHLDWWLGGGVFLGFAAVLHAMRRRPEALEWRAVANDRGLEMLENRSAPMVDVMVTSPQRSGFVLRGLAGRRSVPIHIWPVECGTRECAAYVAMVALPDEVGERLTRSSMRRRSLRYPPIFQQHDVLTLELESERLSSTCDIRVDGADDPARWRECFDPTLIDLLAEGIDIAWFHDGTRLAIAIPVDRAGLLQPDTARIDTLVVAATALERRMALAASDGLPMPAAAPSWAPTEAGPSSAGRDARHLARERERDLALQAQDPEALFDELARYASEEEVASVRAKVESGQFPIDWLDDLVHHRRSASWDAKGDAA